jgi:glutaredoxin 2
MSLGLLGMEYTSTVLPYDDEATPIGLTGKKELPIAVIDDVVVKESLDIMEALNPHLKTEIPQDLEDLLKVWGNNVHNLAMPYWSWTPEFNETSRAYFEKKKSLKRGPFKDLVNKSDEFKAQILNDLVVLEKRIKPFYQSDSYTTLDLVIAAQLWGLYMVPEFQFPPAIHDYLQKVKEICNFKYHQDFWR